MTRRRLVSFSAALGCSLLACPLASAQAIDQPGQPGADLPMAEPPVAPARFFESPGIREFSGVMVAKPLPIQEFATIYGHPELAADALQRARAIIAARFAGVRSVDDTGELLFLTPPDRTEVEVAESLLATGLFEYVEPDWVLYPLSTTPNDPQLSQQWHHTVIRSRDAWSLATGTPDIVTAYVDTGYDLNHPDLQTQYVLGYNSKDRVAQIDGGDVNDINGHGTGVAGTGAARGDNGVGVSGVGWNLGIMPVRTTNSPTGGASLSDILAGARWAVDNGARIASCSYSGVDAGSINTSGQYIWDRGGLLVYAAGNDNRNLSGFDHEFAIVVGATAANDSKSSFSAFGRGVDVFAPGSGIRTTRNGGGYDSVSGTSFATPMVNGLLGLIWAVDPVGLSNANVQEILFTTAADFGDPGDDEFWGRGRIDAAAAVQRAVDSLVPAPPIAEDDLFDTIDGDPVLLDVLDNDFDPNFDALTLLAADAVSSAGGLVEIVDNQIRYTPAPGTFFGPSQPHTFSYTVRDATGADSTAAVSVTVFDGTTFLSPADRPTFSNLGLNVAYYDLDNPSQLPDFSQLTPYKEDALGFLFWPSTSGVFALSERDENVGAVLTGFVDVPVDEIYTFYLESDDGSKLWIGDQLVVDNDGLHGMIERSGIVGLREGLHPIRIEFFERSGGAGLIVSMEGGGLAKRDIPPQWLVRPTEPPAVTPCTVDFNDDGLVNASDLLVILGSFGEQTLAPFDPGDANGDGLVNADDLLGLLSFFGQPCTDG